MMGGKEGWIHPQVLLKNGFLYSNFFSRSLSVIFLLILLFFFLGNFLRNTSAKVSSLIPGHG